jgi:secreted trypsin-like serine protease
MEEKDMYILLVAFTIAGIMVFLVIKQQKSPPSPLPGIVDSVVPNIVPSPNAPGVVPSGIIDSIISGITGIIPGAVPTPVPGAVPTPVPGAVPTPVPGAVPTLMKCGISNTKAAYLINGTAVFPGKYPWVCAFVKTPTTPEPAVCTGTLISPLWILSAAHCQFPPVPVTIGAVDISKKEPQTQFRNVIEVINHPKFIEKQGVIMGGDICLMKLDSPVSINNYVQPICLPTANLDLTGKQLVAAGFGSTSATVIQSSAILREGVFTEVNTCSTSLFNKADKICLKSSASQICVGDSGGPLMLNQNGMYYIVGVCSTGEGQTCFPPFIHTRVSAYLPWIRQYVKDI